MNIQCALVDDSLNDIQIIRDTILHLCHDKNITFQFSFFQKSSDPEILNPFDIYVLDIDMPEMDGFVLADKIYEKYPHSVIIFCTMHDNLIYDSLRMNAFYFVRKNNLEEDMAYSLKKYLSLHTYDTYVAKISDGVKRIPFDQIIYFEVVHNDVYIHLQNNDEIRERKTLQKLSVELSSTEFIQIGKSFLVNIRHIKNAEMYKASLSNGQMIEIPKSQYSSVKKALLAYSSR